MSGHRWEGQSHPAPITAFPRGTSPALIYPLTRQGRWAHQGLELSLVGGPDIVCPVVPPEGVRAP